MAPPIRYYKYDPSIPLAIIGGIAFAALFVAHTIRAWRFRSRYMAIMLVVCGMEVVGFAARVYSINHLTDRTAVIVSSIGLIIPPVLSCAALYMIFGRFIHYIGNQYSFLRGNLVAVVFIVSDVVTFLVQVYGATALVGSNTGPDVERGRKILMVGLVIQIVSFVVFVIAIIAFHLRVQSRSAAMIPHRAQWTPLLWALHINSACIVVRSVFRIVEFSKVLPALETTEVYFYVFDTLLIVVATAALVVWHPGNRIFPEKPLREEALGEEFGGAAAAADQHHGLDSIRTVNK
ncbi:hypothetical protein HDU86_000050 [Geranomyces michiganensis]|nr:hypothetical protein HDU86_000050 [Geranomyces michiganensis]